MMNPHTKLGALRQLQDAWEAINAMPTTTECKDCQFFDAGYCKIWQDNVPQEVRKAGCEKYVFDPLSAPF